MENGLGGQELEEVGHQTAVVMVRLGGSQGRRGDAVRLGLCLEVEVTRIADGLAGDWSGMEQNQ